jgi:hypothetical protein
LPHKYEHKYIRELKMSANIISCIHAKFNNIPFTIMLIILEYIIARQPFVNSIIYDEHILIMHREIDTRLFETRQPPLKQIANYY